MIDEVIIKQGIDKTITMIIVGGWAIKMVVPYLDGGCFNSTSILIFDRKAVNNPYK
jgi:hypothetical protein